RLRAPRHAPHERRRRGALRRSGALWRVRRGRRHRLRLRVRLARRHRRRRARSVRAPSGAHRAARRVPRRRRRPCRAVLRLLRRELLTMRLRVVTWNVHGCVGTDGRFAPERTADALIELAPDVAFLQEVGDNRGVHPPIDQAMTIAQAVGLHCAIGITMPREPFGYGNCTLSRWPILESSTTDLSYIGREPRACLRAVVGHESLRLTTLNVHLGLGASERPY